MLCCVLLWCEVKWSEVMYFIFHSVLCAYVKCLTVKSFCFYIKLNAFLILVNWQPDQPKKKSFTLVEWIFKWRNNNIMICTIDFIFCIVHVPFAVRDRVLHTHIHIDNHSSSPVMWTIQCISLYTMSGTRTGNSNTFLWLPPSALPPIVRPQITQWFNCFSNVKDIFW